jgi:ribose transport system ATP-binding protein
MEKDRRRGSSLSACEPGREGLCRGRGRKIVSVGPILQARGITKEFPGVRALEDVGFELNPGEVHVLIGENGAGKSTLSKILMGVYTPDRGEILFEGRPVSIRNPLEARRYGIAGVHQEFMLIPWLNVAQNIFINREPRIWKSLPFIDHRRMHAETRDVLSQLDLSIDTKRPVKYLGTAQQQMVEIAKILALNPKVVIFDEPTAVLTEREVERLFGRIRTLRAQGVGIVYISHRLPEIRKIGDRVTVLRDGKYVGTVPIGEVSDDGLVQMMVGRSITQLYARHRRPAGKEVLQVRRAASKGKVPEPELSVREGEIVGLAGLVGAGRTELVRSVFGADPLNRGEINLFERKVTPKSPSQMISLGMGFLPEDRKQHGLAVKSTVAWNTVMASLRKRFPGFLVSRAGVERIAQRYVTDLRIATPSVRRVARYLSGGNQQKVVLAKWLDTESRMLIFDEPTRGIDVGAKVEVHGLMDRLAGEGAAILMISSDLPEVLGMSDRIYVMFQGRIVGHFSHEEATQDKIASLMLGIGVRTDAGQDDVAAAG